MLLLRRRRRHAAGRLMDMPRESKGAKVIVWPRGASDRKRLAPRAFRCTRRRRRRRRQAIGRLVDADIFIGKFSSGISRSAPAPARPRPPAGRAPTVQRTGYPLAGRAAWRCCGSHLSVPLAAAPPRDSNPPPPAAAARWIGVIWVAGDDGLKLDDGGGS